MKKCVINILIVFGCLALPGTRVLTASAQTNEGVGYPLPLVGHWNLGEAPNGFSPTYQIKLMEQGKHILPWFLLANWNIQPDNPYWVEYYEAAIKKAAVLKLPIALVSTQWEIWLSVEDRYLSLPANENPNVVTLDGKISREVSPVGGVRAWRDLGRRWTDSRIMKKLQELYPDPPYILFVSNNEHVKLPWNRLQEDRRYVEKYGADRSDELKRQVTAEGWIERYRAIQEGLREGLSNENWRAKAIFIGYNAFGPAHFARWAGWQEYSLYNRGRIDPAALAWDGCSVPYYVFNWSAITDYTVFSPQIEAMNWVFMQAEARRQNPEFWFEMSVWNGNMPGDASDKLAGYLKQGQSYSPERYKGMAQFGMWLLRPRLVREFRSWLETVTDFESYFLPLVESVERVHNQVVLRDFWQKGKLVANKANKHPYQSIVPVEYESVDRWFLLDTSLDPARPWQLGTQLPVYALALTQGKVPQRQWLIYAHAPLGEQQQVAIRVPDYRSVKIDVSVGGSFYLVDEKWQRVAPVR
ncbi:MAG: hypothetical protein HYR56_16740 [Acidobacteria bacterium]|nr:hypothetical protein [Acidobacteriota bacterium]MBI3428054.1 hypothetical protein [Acidobacteriota bacterium]